MEILLLIVGVIVGLVAGYALANAKKSAADTKVQMLEKMLSDQKAEADKAISELKAEAEQAMSNAKAESDRTISELKAEHKANLEDAQNKYKEQLQEQKALHDEQLKMQITTLKAELKSTTEDLLKRRQEELSVANKEQISQILSPLNEGIRQMKDEVQKDRTERLSGLADLKKVLDISAQQADKLGQKTENLTQALSGNNKYQGGFGEMQLRQMLEGMGLQRGVQFEEQVTLRDESGNAIIDSDSGSRMQPDVILHFPDKRDVIIDSKVSLTAYMRYVDTSLSDSDRQQALADHVTSLKNQIRNLSTKSYWKQYEQKGMKLDFVVMFVCNDGALQAAISASPSLWQDAYEKGVLVTGPQNLYALLRMLELSWKQMAQVENQENIIKCANDIVSRAQMFYQRLLELESAFDKVHDKMGELKITVAPKGRSIVTSARKLLDYGASEDKKKISLPQEDDTLVLKD